MPRYWLISDRNNNGTGTGLNNNGLSYFVSDAGPLNNIANWWRVSPGSFRTQLAAAADQFPDLNPGQNESQSHVTILIHGFNVSFNSSTSFYQDASVTPCKAKVSVIAHSMGDYVLQKAMAAAWTRKNQPLLVSHSDKDDAVGKAFPLAQNLNLFARLNPNKTSSTGLGATGPSAATTAAFPSSLQVAVAWGSKFAGSVPAPEHGSTLVVADLTPIHSEPQNHFDGGLSGHHSDIFLPEIYDLMSWFLFA